MGQAVGLDKTKRIVSFFSLSCELITDVAVPSPKASVATLIARCIARTQSSRWLTKANSFLFKLNQIEYGPIKECPCMGRALTSLLNKPVTMHHHHWNCCCVLPYLDDMYSLIAQYNEPNMGNMKESKPVVKVVDI